ARVHRVRRTRKRPDNMEGEELRAMARWSRGSTGLVVAAFVFAAALLSGCGNSGNSQDTASKGLPKEIVIGAAIAKTGVYSPYDASIAAAELLIDETNAKGGINGHRLKLVEADTRSDPQHAVVAAQEIVG